MINRNAESFSNANALIVAVSIIAIIWSSGMADSAFVSLEHLTRNGTVDASAARLDPREPLQTAAADEPGPSSFHSSTPDY
jgi:hypothetical protein